MAGSTRVFRGLALALSCLWAAAAAGQRGGAFTESRDHDAILYSSRETTDPVAQLNRRIQDGQAKLAFDGPRGYLRAVLDELGVPVESQMLVFSETSFQFEQISYTTPRALYFNDTTWVGWVHEGDALEVAAQDPQQGVVFYELAQRTDTPPRFTRNRRCMECHLSPTNTIGVPGVFSMSMLPLSDNPNEYAQGWMVDHRTPIEERWGGWFVTGAKAPMKHLGNVPVLHVPRSYVREPRAPVLKTVEKIDSRLYLTPYSDVVALMLFNHQTQFMNLVTRLGWEARIAAHAAASGKPAAGITPGMRDTIDDLVDYMLFIDEAPIAGDIQGSSGFAEKFSARGPADSKGRSFRQLDLETRLLRYPCSYMIYTPAFDALPPAVKTAVYERMWRILSGQDPDKAYTRLTPGDRQAIIEILRATKKDLPASFK